MKEKVLVLNCSRDTFKDDKGNIVAYSKVTLGHTAEQSDNFAGFVLEEITGKVDDYKVIKDFVGKTVNVELVYKKVDRKNYRAKIEKIEEITL